MFFLLTAGVFIDVNQILGRELVDSVLYVQFVPSMVRFLNVCTLASAGFILVSALTLLFGRVYCSMICPLGILMDLVIGLKNRFRKFRNIPLMRSPLVQYYADHKSISIGFRKKHNVRIFSLIKYSILILFILAFLSNAIFLVGLLDPFSLTGKIIVNLFKPVYILDFNVERLPMVLFILVVFSVLVFLSWFKDRWYCNVICPVGTLLGLISKFSLFRLRINLSRCTKCGTCLQACKAGCIHPDDYHIEAERCVCCFDCIDVCAEGGAGVKIMNPGSIISELKVNARQNGNGHGFEMLAGSDRNVDRKRKWTSSPQLSQTKNEAGNLSRRRFIGTFLTGVSGILFTHRSLSENPETKNSVEGKNTRVALKATPVIPPGSWEITRFTGLCSSCHLCISECQSGVLQPAFLEYGLQGIFQPRMDFQSGYCLSDCIRCSEVCPTDAIQLIDLNIKKRLKIGSSVFIRNLCLVQTERRPCGMCAAACRQKAIRLVPWLGNLLIPEVDDLKCTGCGACELVCPVRPHRAIMVDALTEHQLLK